MNFKNVSKRIAAGVFAMLLVLCMFDDVHASKADIGHIKTVFNDGEGDFSVPQDPLYTSKNEPKFELEGGNNLGSFAVAKKQQIQIALKNVSTNTAYNVKIELKPDPKDEKLFVSKAFTADEKAISPKKSKTYKFPFEFKSATPEGTYNMTLRVIYKNAYRNDYVKEFPVYMYVQNGNIKPVLELGGIEYQSQWIHSDEASKMRVKIKNNGTLLAKNVEVKLDGLDPKGVFLSNDSAFRKVQTIKGGEETWFAFDLKANPNVEQDQELSLNLSYFDAVDNKYESTNKILVPCSSTSGSENKYSAIEMIFSKPLYSVYGDSQTTVELTLKNNGEKDFKNFKLELSSDQGVVFMSNYLDIIDVLKAGESKKFTYTVVSANAESDGNHPVTAKISDVNAAPEDTKNTKIQVSGVTTFKKDNKDGEDGKKAKIIISDYKFSGEKVVAGKEFLLTIDVRNTSQSIGVKNVKITHTSQDDIFIPLDSANSIFIDNIPPNAVVQKTIKLTSKPDAQAKMYKITFKGEYEDYDGKSYDEKGNPFSSEESIVLNLTQQIRLNIPELNIPENGVVGEGIPIDVEFYNMGKAPLYNMLVKIKGDFDTDVANYFVGNFEASKSDMFSTKITPKKKGKLKGKIIFEFEDESGNKSVEKKEFTMDVKENDNPPADDIGMSPPANLAYDENGNPYLADEKSSGLSTSSIVIIVIVAIIAIFIIIKIIKKRKKKKLEKMLLETDDEDK